MATSHFDRALRAMAKSAASSRATEIVRSSQGARGLTVIGLLVTVLMVTDQEETAPLVIVRSVHVLKVTVPIAPAMVKSAASSRARVEIVRSAPVKAAAAIVRSSQGEIAPLVIVHTETGQGGIAPLEIALMVTGQEVTGPQVIVRSVRVLKAAAIARSSQGGIVPLVIVHTETVPLVTGLSGHAPKVIVRTVLVMAKSAASSRVKVEIVHTAPVKAAAEIGPTATSPIAHAAMATGRCARVLSAKKVLRARKMLNASLGKPTRCPRSRARSALPRQWHAPASPQGVMQKR
jgi:hypothetical protein